MSTRKAGLGRGLDALIRDGTTTQQQQQQPTPAPQTTPAAGIVQIPEAAIRAGQWQPRQDFDDEALQELSESIRERGILQPLLVRRSGEGYELIAGERRLRAARAAGLKDVPVLIMDVGDADALELALIENLQREDLNPIEEAEGYALLASRFKLTQEDIANRMGKARASVANAMRILKLPDAAKAAIADGRLGTGHAKVLLGLDIPQEQLLFAQRAVRENLSVRQLEKLVERAHSVPRKPRAARSDIPTAHVTYLSDRLHTHLGTSVKLTPSRTYANGRKSRGSLQIEFYSNDDLDRILKLLNIPID